MNQGYLSIGTVLTLRGEPFKVMVIGYFGQHESGRTVDYMGVSYPDGFIDPTKIIGFNKTEIESILFEGYKTAEQANLYNELDTVAQGYFTNTQPTVPFVPNQQNPTDNNGNMYQ